MITYPKDQITVTQAAVVVSNTIIGTGILTSPRTIAQEVGSPDGWISVILSGMIALLAGYVVAKLSQRFPGQTFYEYSQIVVGKFLGRIHGGIFTFYFLLSAGFQLRAMGEMIRMYLLDNTPIEVIIIFFMSVATYLMVGGINAIARLFELFLPFIILILLSLVVFSLGDFKLENIRPVMGDGITPIFNGIKTSALSLSGFEVMLLFTAFMKEPQKAVKSTLIGIGVVIPLYVLIVVMCIGTFGIDELKTLTWPMMEDAMSIEVPGGVLERFESLFSILWVMTMYTTFVPFHYAASLGLGQLLNRNYQTFIFASLPVIYLIAMYPENLDNVFALGSFIGYSSVFIMGIMPFYFWIIAMIRGKGIASY
ncbi:GerAB/ArcD/ProY family transporter [Bacillus sp. BRMEA1]|uniref:GerAB/ArcD/ProY family transporter n=1 Tax=Neobacillus endophyticus TaxID=2738405 RepID=UPI0015676476|nr:GerAB/ArcD/ProY family transporter [Neobacillus endophyticus]NRD77741.1 GerAB/ArcD/ProY family transporter [Neobacillus endophyticus]